MKKLLPVLAISAGVILMTSCSTTSTKEADSGSQTEELGANWFYQNGNVQYNDTSLNEKGEGAHFTLCAPQNVEGLIRSHFVAIPKDVNKDNKVTLTYASPRAYEITSFQSAIAEAVAKNEDSLNALLPEGYSVQTQWSVSVDIEAKDSNGLFIEYMPLRFNYYKATDESVKENALLYTYVIVPVKVTVTDYEVNTNDTNYQTKYTFTSDYANSKKETLINWTADAYGRIK